MVQLSAFVCEDCLGCNKKLMLQSGVALSTVLSGAPLVSWGCIKVIDIVPALSVAKPLHNQDSFEGVWY